MDMNATKEKILIADDSQINREILMDILGDSYTYVLADDGVQTLEKLAEETDVDLLLLDINMPRLDGFGVLEKMNAEGLIKTVPVVIISAEIDAGIIQHTYDLGVMDYINRPFNMGVVRRRVSNTLMLYAQQKRLVQLVEEQVYEREKTNSSMINILSYVIESRNGETGVHLLHVRMITDLMLHKLATVTDRYPMTESDISMIVNLSALHDIGKIAVPEAVLNKPGKLDPQEWEQMKNHTVAGDKILLEMPGSKVDPMLVTARAICRWHHERWDGQGYPDGLKGDEIPISAQIVALADVYDALTNERCYKKAFSHEMAVRMILNNECGAFNPLLRQCLEAVADQLPEVTKVDPQLFDYTTEARRLTGEMLEQDAIPQDDRDRRKLVVAKVKAAFFGELMGGIQFDYDVQEQRINYTNWYLPEEKRELIFFLRDHIPQEFLTAEQWQELVRRVRACTPEEPSFRMNVLIPVSGTLRWHRLSVRTIWQENDTAYSYVIGQFMDVHEDVLHRGAQALQSLSEDYRIAMDMLGNLNGLFELARLVDPETNRILKLDGDGHVVETDVCCYDIWGRGEACKNCSSLSAVKKKEWVSRLEIKDGMVYFVLSRGLDVLGRRCVLELSSRVDDSAGDKSGGRVSEKAGILLLDFYRDPVTNAYSRMYLESFQENLDHADGVALIDVDHFKQINDRYGHPIGDAALRRTSEAMLSCIRSADVLIRYGGDEFLLIFNRISEEAFYKRLESIRQAVANTTLEEMPEAKLSVSIGGAYQVHPLEEAIRRADQAMYSHKPYSGI